MKFVHGHSSSRYDRSPKSLADQVKRATGSDKDPNLLTFTEVGKPERAEKLQADGWGAFTPHGKTDCGIMWLKVDFDVVEKRVDRLTDKTWKDGQGNTHHSDATTVILEAKDNGKRAWVSLIHLPSGVQDGPKFSDNTAKVNAWKGATKGWAQVHKDQRKKYGCSVSLYVADWNVDFKVKDWRNRVAELYPNCSCSWKSPYPNGGTHGKRLIDATWSDGKFQKCVLLPDDDSSDHRPFGEILQWP